MRIVIASSFVPFINGGARFIVEWLEQKLREHGHEVEHFYLPFQDEADTLLQQILAYRLLDLEGSCDQLITFRPPAYAIRHPNKVVWFIHHIRAFYDLAGTKYQGFDNTPKGRADRDALLDVDNTTLREARKIFTNSRVVAGRLKTFNAIEAETLYPPLIEPERFRNEGYGDEVVSICRVEDHKRQALLVEAMRHTRTPVRLRISGMSAGPDYRGRLDGLIQESGAADRITFEHRWISEEEKAERVNKALAVAYLPLDEDSYGYPSLEAACAEKPILTATDSGGVLEFVEDGRSGLVTEPHPADVARALDRLYAERDLVQRLGGGARERVSELKIDWDHVIASITA